MPRLGFQFVQASVAQLTQNLTGVQPMEAWNSAASAFFPSFRLDFIELYGDLTLSCEVDAVLYLFKDACVTRKGAKKK